MGYQMGDKQFLQEFNWEQRVGQLSSPNEEDQLFGAAAIHRALSLDNSGTIALGLWKSGAVPLLLDILASSADEQLLIEASRALATIAAGSRRQTLQLAKAGFVDSLAEITKEQIESSEPNLDLIRNATRAMSNLCKNQPPPRMEVILPMVNVCMQLLQQKDDSVACEACWCLSHVSMSEEGADLISNRATCQTLVQLFGRSENGQEPALRCIGNLLSRSNEQTQMILDEKFLQVATKHLQDGVSDSVGREICWALSNIAGGTANQVQMMFDEEGLLPSLFRCLRDGSHKIRTEAIWVFSNLTADGGTPEQCCRLADLGLIQQFDELLTDLDDDQLVDVLLEGILNIIVKGRKAQDYRNYFPLLEQTFFSKLADHPSASVRDKVKQISEIGSSASRTKSAYNNN